MHTLLLVPGVIGSRLKFGKVEIWPPTAAEFLTHYGRIDYLLRADLELGKVISNIGCIPIYSPLEATLKAIARHLTESGAPTRAVSFSYDWRLDWRNIAGHLARKLEKLTANGNEVSIIAHSMGGMIARLVLESPAVNHAWIGQVGQLITLCTPHLGAPQAVAAAMGQLGMAAGCVTPADTKRFAADPRYPSGYQLFTRPERPVVYRNDVPLDIYDCTIARSLGLDCKLERPAREAWTLLDIARKPASCRYTFVAANDGPGKDGRGTTLDSLKTSNLKKFKKVPAFGDGTVPAWSSRPYPQIPSHTIPGGHISVLGTTGCKALLYKLLGAKVPADLFKRGGKPVIAATTAKYVHDWGEPVNLFLIPATATRSSKGTIQLFRADTAADRDWKPYGQPQGFEHRGMDVESFSTAIPAPKDRGFYKVIVEGSHISDSDGTAYFVVRGRRHSA